MGYIFLLQKDNQRIMKNIDVDSADVAFEQASSLKLLEKKMDTAVGWWRNWLHLFHCNPLIELVKNGYSNREVKINKSMFQRALCISKVIDTASVLIFLNQQSLYLLL